MNGLLDETQKSRSEAILNVIQEIKTRWNSTFHMLERLLIIKGSVNTTLVETYTVQNKNKSSVITDQDSDDMEQFVEVLSFFNDATNQLSGEFYTTASVVIPC